MKIIISGSRSFTNWKLLRDKLDSITTRLREVIVIHGGAEGTDTLAGKWAVRCWHTQVIYHPDYKKYRKAAPLVRNTEMVKESGAKVLIAFWDGHSPGTRDIIQKARKAGLKVRIIKFTPEE